MTTRRHFLVHAPIGVAGVLGACRNSSPTIERHRGVAHGRRRRRVYPARRLATTSTPRDHSRRRASPPVDAEARGARLHLRRRHAAAAHQVRHAHRHVDRGLLRRRREDRGRSAVEGDAAGTRQSADRPVLHRRRGAGRHRRHPHPQARAGARLRRVVVRAGLRRARRHRSNGDARPRLSGDHVALRRRRRTRHRAHRRRATASTRGTCRSRRSSAASASRRRAAKCARRSCPAPSAATWTAPRCARATRSFSA